MMDSEMDRRFNGSRETQTSHASGDVAIKTLQNGWNLRAAML